jgi:hypothetical protein
MTPHLRIAHGVLVLWVVLGTWFGCSSTDVQRGAGEGTPTVLQRGTGVGQEQVEVLLARLARVRAASQEALEAAAVIGTSTRELAVAQQAWATAEQSWQEGYQAYEVGQYQESWERLQPSEAAFKVAEERAVHAGLAHIERELAQAYAHMLPIDAPRSGVRRNFIQVVEGVESLRDRASLNAQIIGKAHAGQRMQILAEVGEWYWVQTEQGSIGWVSKSRVVRVQ